MQSQLHFFYFKKQLFLLSALFLFSFSSNIYAQQQQCYTMENRDRLEKVETFNYPTYDKNGLQKNGGTWDVMEGYGSACSKGCDLTTTVRMPSAQACDSDPCGNGTGVYLIPVKVTIFRNDDGSNPAVTAALVSQQIADMNTFHCCQGIPIQFYEIADSPVFEDNTSLNNGGVFPSSTYNSSQYFDIFVVSATQNGAGCNGFAALPFSSNSGSYTVMDNNCFGTIADPCADTEEGIVLFHEIGHSLGLYHTHETDIQLNNATTNDCDDPSITTDDCTNGDGISDTDEDPDFSGNEIGCTGCDTGTNSQPDCSFDNSLPNCAAYGTPNTLDNMMSYNNFQGCRQNYSECQKAKMVDALICARTNYCDEDLARYFSDVNDAVKEICVGDALPTFTLDQRTCVQWFATQADGAMLSSGASFTPTSAQVDVNTPGEYEIWFQDNNAYEASRCKKVTVKVVAKSGDAMDDTQCITATQNLDNTLMNSSNVSSKETIGWWITKTNPIASSVTTQSLLDAQSPTVLSANDGSSNMENVVIKNSTLSTDGLLVNCDNLMSGVTYYATPFIALNDNTAPTDFTTTESFPSSTWATAPNSVNVDVTTCQLPTNATLTKVCVELVYPGFGVANDLDIALSYGGTSIVLESFFAGSTNGSGYTYDFCFVDDGTGYTGASSTGCNGTVPNCLTGDLESDQSFAAFDSDDPNGTWTLTITDDFNPGFGISSATVSVEFDQAAVATTFPTASYSTCLFGEPIAFNCSDLAFTTTSDCTDNTGTVNFDFTGGSPNYTITGIVTGTLSADGSLTGAAASGDVTVTDDNGCSLTQAVTVAGNCALPVELTRFEAKSTLECQVNLNWETASEFNNSHFEIEHSTNSKNFQPFAKVIGAGTTLEKQSYDYLHIQATEGTNYYRLKQVDIDGQFSYSEVVVVTANCGEEKEILDVYPNPVRGNTLTVELFEKDQTELTLTITDLYGCKLGSYTQAISIGQKNTIFLSIENLPAGLYFLSSNSGDTVRFIKE